MGRKHQTFPKKNIEEENETIKELKSANRRLKSEIERLKSELATLEQAFNKTSTYLKDNTDNISVETIIKGVKKGKTLKQINDLGDCSKCKSSTLKEMNMGKGGIMLWCLSCNHRERVHGEKEEKE